MTTVCDPGTQTRTALVFSIFDGNFDLAFILADLLQEENQERRGVLLRRRARAWQKARILAMRRDREQERLNSLRVPILHTVAFLQSQGVMGPDARCIDCQVLTSRTVHQDKSFWQYMRWRFFWEHKAWMDRRYMGRRPRRFPGYHPC